MSSSDPLPARSLPVSDTPTDGTQTRGTQTGSTAGTDEELLGDLAAVLSRGADAGEVFARLVGLVGSSEASRRWLEYHSASDAAET
jgi:hypothetical protein